MGHTRLSIIGLDDRGTQPFENGSHVLAFNGEIYNFVQIRERLRQVGRVVRGATDTEVLLEAWSEWGAAILRDLTGCWALAVYDKRSRILSLVRDQFGIKPMYYHHAGGRFVASSLLRVIAEVAPECRALDMLAISEYVRYQFTFEDRTFFTTVKKVLPGHVVEYDLKTGAVSSKMYEDIFGPTANAPQPVTDEWVAETRVLLERAVVETSISDASFTTLCSGGIDSSLITRLARPEIAYHCNYSDPECNETFFAKQVVEGTATRLFTVNASEDFNLVSRLADLISDFDELSIGSVILPLDDLLSQVKRRYKVVLSGTGGDELFAGYVRYQLVMGECYQDSYKTLFAKVRSLPTAAARFEVTHRKGDPSFYKFYDERAEQSFANAFQRCRESEGSDVAAMLRFDRMHFLQGLLNIDDKISGRHSLETRPSFLHQEFVRHVRGARQDDLLAAKEVKSVLKRVAESALPMSVIRREDKMGFTTPIGTFVNKSAHLIREQVTDSPFREFYDLRRMHFHAETKFSRETFGLLMLDLWLNRYARS
jgi:asparagine synthase (glutamine-hydrolysing)